MALFFLYSRENDRIIQYLHEQNFPFVLIGKPYDRKDEITYVDNDNYAQCLAATANGNCSNGWHPIGLGVLSLFLKKDLYRKDVSIVSFNNALLSEIAALHFRQLM